MFKRERKLHNDPFNTKTIQRIVDRFLETGSVADRHRSGRPGFSEEIIEVVNTTRELLQSSSATGNTSTRRISDEVGLAKSTVHRVLRQKLKLYPYRLQCGQSLSTDQRERRVQFAEWLLEHDGDLENIIWSDEAHFELHGSVNRHNCIIWGSERPTQVIEKPLHSARVTVWMGFSATLRLQPYFFTDSVNGLRHRDMLREHV